MCLPAQDSEPGDMVTVFMGDQDCREVPGRAADLAQSVRDPLAGDPGIDQHAGLIRSDVYAVAAASARDTVEVQLSVPSGSFILSFFF